MDEQRAFLLKVLNIVEGEEGNEDYADMMSTLIFEDSVYKLLQTLPKAKQDKFAKKWDTNRHNPASMQSLLKHYFKEAQIIKVFEETAKMEFIDYLKSIDATLTKDKREKLEKLAEEISLPKFEHVSKPLLIRTNRVH